MAHTNGSAATVTIDGNEADVLRLRWHGVGAKSPRDEASAPHRDRCLTVALWAAWSRPVEALARLAAGDPGSGAGPDWAGFVSDVAAAGRVAGVLMALLVGWGAYGRWRGGDVTGSPATSEPPPSVEAL